MSNKKKKNLLLFIRIIVSIILLAVLVLFADPASIVQSLRSFNFVWLPFIFGLIALSVVLSALKWGILLNVQGNRVGLVQLFRIYVTGLFFNNFLPSSIGGDGVRIFLAGRQSGRTSAAAASVVVERVLATVSLALLGLGGAVFAKNSSNLAVWLLLALLAVGTIAILILLSGWVPGFIIRNEGKKGKAGETAKAAKAAKAWISFAESASELKKKPKVLIKAFLLSFLFQITVAFVVASVMAGLRLPFTGLSDLFFVTSAASVLAMVPAGLNGYGLREGAYVVLLAPLGYTSSSALAVSVLFALFVSVFSLGGGIDWMISRPGIKTSLMNREGVI